MHATLTYPPLPCGRFFTKSNVRGYCFGFNGQMKDDEVYGEANSYTAEYWQYDPRLGRRWEIDPASNKFPWQSPYCVFDNNPILFVDSKGDSTRYYYRGQLIGISHEGPGQLVTFFDTEQQIQQAKDVFLVHLKAGGSIDDPVFNAKLQSIGTTYDLAQFQQFYELNKNDVRKEAPYPGYVNEHGTFLYEKNGVVGIGKENIQGDAIFIDFGTAPAGAIGELHTHPNAGKRSSFVSSFGYGPSKEDMENNSVPFYNVIVDPTSIYMSGSSTFPNDNKDGIIDIPRSGTFNRESSDMKAISVPENLKY